MNDVKLTNNFSLSEFCVSASHPKLVEVPGKGTKVYNNIKHLAESVLQPIREHIGRPLTITSGYRPYALNTAVKGAKNSNHLYGYAVDLVTRNGGRDNLDIVYALFELGIDFDECIIEKGSLTAPQWIHLAVKPEGNRRKFLYTPDARTYKELSMDREVNWKINYK